MRGQEQESYCQKQGPGVTPRARYGSSLHSWGMVGLVGGDGGITSYRAISCCLGWLVTRLTRETSRGACPSLPLQQEQSLAGVGVSVCLGQLWVSGMGEAGPGGAGGYREKANSHLGWSDLTTGLKTTGWETFSSWSDSTLAYKNYRFSTQMISSNPLATY